MSNTFVHLTMDEIKNKTELCYLAAVRGDLPFDYSSINSAVKAMPDEKSVLIAAEMYKVIGSTLGTVLQKQKRDIEHMIQRNQKLQKVFTNIFNKEKARRRSCVFRSKKKIQKIE